MALSIDGTALGSQTAPSTGAPTTSVGPDNLSTSAAGDIVVIIVGLENWSGTGGYSNMATVTVGGSAATLRNRFQYQTSATFDGGSGQAWNTLEVWWFYASSALTNAVITGTVAGTTANPDAAILNAFAVKGFTGQPGGAYSTNPWDQSATTALAFAASQPTSATTRTQLISGNNISTVDGASLIFSTGGSSDNGGTVDFLSAYATGPIAGTTATDSGLGSIQAAGNVNGFIMATEYRVLSATISGQSAAFGTGATAGAWGLVTDALAQNGGGGGGGGAGTNCLAIPRRMFLRR